MGRMQKHHLGGLQMLKKQMPPHAIQVSTSGMPSWCCSSWEQGDSITLGTWMGGEQRMEKHRGAASVNQRCWI